MKHTPQVKPRGHTANRWRQTQMNTTEPNFYIPRTGKRKGRPKAGKYIFARPNH